MTLPSACRSPSGTRTRSSRRLTGYMPPAFEEFHQFNLQTGEVEPLSDGPGEGPNPVIFSVQGGTHAMGIYALPTRAEYYRPQLRTLPVCAEKVVKWNCVFRVTDKNGIAPGEYAYRMFVIVGELNTVCDSLRVLHHP